MLPKISVICTCANYAKYVKAAIRSVESQTYTGPIEMVIVDDCSSDKSWPNILEAAAQLSWVKPIRNESRQYCGTSNAIALEAATGDICAVLDGDDILKPNAIETLVDLYNRHPQVGYIYTSHEKVNKMLLEPKRGVSCLPLPGMNMLQTYNKRGLHCFSHWRTFRTHLRDETTIFKRGLKYAVDKYMGFALEEIAIGGFCPKSLYFYRFHKSNMTSTQKEQKPTAKAVAEEFSHKRKHEHIKAKEIIQVE